MNKEQLEAAHEHCRANKEETRRSKRVGCFCCRKIFFPNKIEEYTAGDSVICPYCGVDSVIGDASGLRMTPKLMDEMFQEFFNKIYDVHGNFTGYFNDPNGGNV